LIARKEENMAFWRHYYHLVWATKERLPLISDDVESELYKYIFGKITSLQCISYAIGGIDNHIHLVASIPPKLSIADFVKNIKGSSSYHLNHGGVEFQSAFGWQRGYGSFTLGKRQLDHAIHYVLNQKQHHLQNTVILALERDDEEDEGPEPSGYNSESWVNTVREEFSPYNLLDEIL
jgi:REP element-mobilizing transposase RayT